MTNKIQGPPCVRCGKPSERAWCLKTGQNGWADFNGTKTLPGAITWCDTCANERTRIHGSCNDGATIAQWMIDNSIVKGSRKSAQLSKKELAEDRETWLGDSMVAAEPDDPLDFFRKMMT